MLRFPKLLMYGGIVKTPSYKRLLEIFGRKPWDGSLTTRGGPAIRTKVDDWEPDVEDLVTARRIAEKFTDNNDSFRAPKEPVDSPDSELGKALTILMLSKQDGNTSRIALSDDQKLACDALFHGALMSVDDDSRRKILYSLFSIPNTHIGEPLQGSHWNIDALKKSILARKILFYLDEKTVDDLAFIMTEKLSDMNKSHPLYHALQNGLNYKLGRRAHELVFRRLIDKEPYNFDPLTWAIQSGSVRKLQEQAAGIGELLVNADTFRSLANLRLMFEYGLGNCVSLNTTTLLSWVEKLRLGDTDQHGDVLMAIAEFAGERTGASVVKQGPIANGQYIDLIYMDTSPLSVGAPEPTLVGIKYDGNYYLGKDPVERFKEKFNLNNNYRESRIFPSLPPEAIDALYLELAVILDNAHTMARPVLAPTLFQ
mgnify:CR=1 FL=1